MSMQFSTSIILLLIGICGLCLCLFHTVDQVQLNRAKQATKSAILMNLESRVCNINSTAVLHWFGYVCSIIYVLTTDV